MTFDEVIDRVVKRLNYNGTAAEDRVAETINDVYREVTSYAGLDLIRKAQTDYSIISTNPTYADLPDITFTGMEKIYSIEVVPTNGLPWVLELVPIDVLIQDKVHSRTPRRYAVKNYGTTSVTIRLDGFPTATTFVLRVSHLEDASTLTREDEIPFSESFHDILVHGALTYEYLKLEKDRLAAISDSRYRHRLNEFKYFQIKNGYQTIKQGKESSNNKWWLHNKRF